MSKGAKSDSSSIMKLNKLRVGLLGGFVIFFLIYYQQSLIANTSKIVIKPINMDTLYQHPGSHRYLVNGPNCRIPDVDPFNSDIMPFYEPIQYYPCRNFELFTYTTSDGNVATLHVNETAVQANGLRSVSCCYSMVSRKFVKDSPDDEVEYSACVDFENNVTISDGYVVFVKCKAYGIEIYKNVHGAFRITEEMKRRVELKKNKKPLSILMVGIDSMSRLNLKRVMPKTSEFLERNQWLNLKGYNKIADNTFPNLMAVLTGKNDSYSYETCYPLSVGNLDKCDMLWYRFRKMGFITGFAEDDKYLNTFNYLKKGFIKPPTDFYFRPYTIAAEQLSVQINHRMIYCSGPETSGERILKLARDFAVATLGYPSFGLFWMNTFSHDNINFASSVDNKVTDFLEDIKNSDILENSIMIFFSDHGFRFGEVRFTHTGWLEERLPFIYVWFPKWFKTQFSKEFNNFKVNTERLTTPYDLFMTLQHLIVLAGHKDYEIVPSSACPKCKSLFHQVDYRRSCEDAGIEQHWCTCNGHSYISPSEPIVVSATYFALDNINSLIKSFGSESEKCAALALNKIRASGISEVISAEEDNRRYLLLILETTPMAVFEATVSFVMNGTSPVFNLHGKISRLDYFGHNKCVTDSILEKYCSCHGLGAFLHGAFCHIFICE